VAAEGNIDQFRHGFQEEARELLVELESVLLELNEQREDGELVGRVFRALHTIKGSGAMFGFDALAAFAHKLENAFDEVRKGRLAVTPELVDLTLEALDQIRVMVEEGEGETEVDPAACAEILAKLRKLTGSAEGAPPASVRHDAKVEAGSSEEAKIEVEAAREEERVWSIRFAPGPDLMRYGADPILLVRELGRMGRLTAKASMADVPALAELEPERCYVTWEMTLATSEGEDAIRDVFIFVEDSCELSIEPVELKSAGAEPAEAEAKTIEARVVVAQAESGSGKQAAANNVCSRDRIAQGLEEKRRATGRRTTDSPDTAASLRVPAAKLDQLVDLVGELVTVQARLSEIAAQSESSDVVAVSEEIDRLTSALRENSMTLRMLPIRATFERFRRLVHDLARDLGKNVELTIEGADTELDKTVIDQLGDPLMHLIRNSMDHGIEHPEQREREGKRPMATIHLSAQHSGASVLVAVSDDGGGIDLEAVRNRAIERGLTTAEAQLSDAEIYKFIFEPGFSTAKQVTDVSGRGVGMDVVRQRVESLRGSIEVTSQRGTATTVTLRLPLTLAIIDGLLVKVGDASFVLPLASTLECIELTREEIEQANGKHVAYVRGEIVPYIRLRQYFAVDTPRPEREQIMVVECEEGRCGLVVDEVLGDCQTVIRNLGRLYRHVQVVSGATILGNGTVALILDPQRLVQEAVRTKMQKERGRLAPAREQENGYPRDGTKNGTGVYAGEPRVGAGQAASVLH
jgi:two-component system chemotaxis sensor kinase CheA